MTNKEIKEKVEESQQRINAMNEAIEAEHEEIKALQQQCKHDEGFLENQKFMWRVGSFTEGKICKVCDKFFAYDIEYWSQ